MTSIKSGWKIVFALLILIFWFACSKNPKAIKITEENKDKFIEQIKDMKGLTVNEGRLLFAYMLRLKMSEAFGNKSDHIYGKTVGELIDDQDKYEKDLKKQEQEQDRLATEARAKEESLAKELQKSINLTVFQKSFIESDPEAGSYNDYIVLKCAYENIGNKDIRAFMGVLKFTDLFDKEIYSSGITISDPLKSGAKATWTGTIDYNQFNDEQKALRYAELKDMKVVWLPKSIIFTDGSKIGE